SPSCCLRTAASSLMRAPCAGWVRARSACWMRRSSSAISSRVRWLSGVAFTSSNLSRDDVAVDVQPDAILTDEPAALAQGSAPLGSAMERLELDHAVGVEGTPALGG